MSHFNVRRTRNGLSRGKETRDGDGLGDIDGGDNLKNRDGGAPFTPPRPVIARDRVRYVGEPVALVVAESLAEARVAAEQIIARHGGLRTGGLSIAECQDGGLSLAEDTDEE